MSLLDEISGFSKDKLKPTTTVERTLPIVDAEGTTGPDTALSGEAIKEFRDDEKTLNTKADELATMIKAAKHLVVYTGAGISTAAKIPDYRGPKGVWTLAARGEAPEMKITLEQALPTYSHMALVALAEKGILKYVVSTNVDGLHLRSGIPTSKLAELHGNIYLEHCMKCKKPYLRQFDVTTRARKHITGRLCEETDCDGKLFDSIINFGELLPTAPLKSASDHSHRADLCLVIGTSMRVSPACDLPSYSYDGEAKGSLVIVNLQKTPFDKDSKLRIFSECDKLMKLVMNKLEIEVKEFKEEKEEDLATKMKGLKVDPAFKPLGTTTNLSMADGGAPPSGLLSEVTGFNKDKLKKPTKPTTTDS